MKFSKLIMFLVASLAMFVISCDTPEPAYTLPQITVTNTDGAEVTSVAFPSEGGELSFTITATRSWSIASQAEWLAINPLSYTNNLLTSEAVEVTITAAPNEGEARNETIKIAMDKSEVNITVAQAGAGQVALGDVIFYDNFDKTVAEKGEYWPYMSADYANPTPENQSAVTYTSQNVTVRSNSTSNSSYSDYDGSGNNNLFFGKVENYVVISGISLAELEGNALTITFGSEKYTQDGDSTFKNDEFTLHISGDGQKWTEVEYSFLDGAELAGRWNLATSQFNLKEVPETLSLRFSASVASVYRLDDVKITSGGGGAEIDLSQGGAISGGGNTGGGTTEPDPSAEAITVAEFIEKADTATTYQLTGTISGSINTQYGNFDLVDESGSIYIYGLVDNSGAAINWADKGLNAGDVITVQGKYFYYEQGSKHEIKNALYISHTDGQGGGTTEPEPPVAGEGDYASDSPFVQATDDSTNAAYGLGDTQIGGQAVTGFKLGKSKQEGKFTSKAVGVSGDKYLNFYAVSWGAGGDKTIYFRVNGGEIMSQDIKANEGAAQNHPYNNLTPTADDHYSVLLSGLTETDVIEFSTNAAFDCATTTDYATRAIFFGVKLTDEALGGTTGGGTTEPEPSVVKATVAEFLTAAEDATIYELTGTIKGTYNTFYGNFYLEDATGEVLIYGILKDGEKCYEALGLKDGDTLTIQGTRASYNGAAQMKNAEYISHTAGQGGGTTEPETPTPGEGTYASDSPFVCSSDDSAKACYGLASSTVCGESATGFKLGKSKQEGVFTSKAIGVSGDKYLNFYAVSWGAGGDKTIYYRVNGGEVLSQDIKANEGAAGSTPYTITVTADDHYSVLLSGLTETDVIEFSSNAAFDCATTTDYATRAIFFGVKLTDEPLSGQGGDEGGTTEPETPADVVVATVAEFLAAAEDNTVYELTGEITRVVNTTYGNFDITDATGTVYVYGLLTPNGESQTQWAAAGLKEGDTITIQGTRTSYDGDPQMKNATYISHTAGEGGDEGGTTEPEPDLGEWAGRDDFNTVAHNSSYIERTTTAGWVAQYCAVQSGGASDSNPVLPSLLGSSTDTRAFCIKGAADAIGTITSPVLNGGIGKLKFTYGLAFTDNNGVDMDITIVQNGEVVKTINVKTACSKYEVQNFEQEINVAGDFQIVFTNNCPSAASSGNKDRVSIWDVMWTAYAE